MDVREMFTARYRTCLRHLAQEVRLLERATDTETPFPYGEDVRENHRRMIERRLMHWATRLDENIRSLVELDAQDSSTNDHD